MEATIYDHTAEQPREALRRARIDLEAATREVQAAKFVQAQIAKGVKVVHEGAPNVEKAERAEASARARVTDIEQVIADIEAEAAEREAEKARAAAEAHAEAVKLADAELLAARREADRALLARLDAAGGKSNDKTYAQAIAEHRDAAARVAAALETLQGLQGDDDEQ